VHADGAEDSGAPSGAQFSSRLRDRWYRSAKPPAIGLRLQRAPRTSKLSCAPSARSCRWAAPAN